MFPNETFCGGPDGEDEEEEEVQECVGQLPQHHLSDTLHGRRNSDSLTFCQNTETGTRCVRREIFTDDVSVDDREGNTSQGKTDQKTDDESLTEEILQETSLKEEIIWKEQVLKENSLALEPVIGMMGQMLKLTGSFGSLVLQQVARLDVLAVQVSAQENMLKKVLEK